jgi:hypothetical protein
LEHCMMNKVLKQVVVSVMYHRQNPLELVEFITSLLT